MSKETLKGLIDLIPEEDIETIYKVVVKFIPEVKPEPDEIAALLDGRVNREKNGTVSHEAINWD